MNEVELKSKETPIDFNTVQEIIASSGLQTVGKASIREVVKLVNDIEKATGEKFIRMEMGVPGLLTPKIGMDAEILAIQNGVNAKYPMLDGLPELKQEIARFVKLFLNTDVNPAGCIPTVGSLQGSSIAFITIDNMWEDRDTALFIDPGFPVHKLQLDVLGKKLETFDVYDYRGDKLYEKLDSILRKGNIHSILYSNPNNPSWVCFTEKELQTIGELANKYDVIVIEDLAYFGMDFRQDYSKPGVPPYQPTVAKYTDNVIHLISGSKMFSYPGPRVGMMVISDKLQTLKRPALKRFYSTDIFGYSMVYGTLYSLTAGTSNSGQHGLHAILKAVNDGTYNFKDDVIEYGEKAIIMKKLFIDNGFKIVYDKDDGIPIADGFYFTISFPGMSGADLLHRLMFYGISAITLDTTRSTRSEGLRACVSLVNRSLFPDLEKRLKKFKEHYL
jgi:aspartate/methionine/tyrosine aminotransferase